MFIVLFVHLLLLLFRILQNVQFHFIWYWHWRTGEDRRVTCDNTTREKQFKLTFNSFAMKNQAHRKKYQKVFYVINRWNNNINFKKVEECYIQKITTFFENHWLVTLFYIYSYKLYLFTFPGLVLPMKIALLSLYSSCGCALLFHTALAPAKLIWHPQIAWRWKHITVFRFQFYSLGKYCFKPLLFINGTSYPLYAAIVLCGPCLQLCPWDKSIRDVQAAELLSCSHKGPQRSDQNL